MRLLEDSGDDDDGEPFIKGCSSDDLEYFDSDTKLRPRTPDEICDYIKSDTDPFTGKEYDEDECEDSHIQFTRMYYCDFQNMFGDKKVYAFFPVGLFLLFVFMRNLGTTADEYLSPSLEYMTIRFGISESLAGVTILAFGNGAPDLFTAMSAGDENAITTFSPLMGSALFISSVVVCLATFASKPDLKIQVTKSLFLRDLLLFIAMDIYLLLILFSLKEINYPIIFSFVLIYIFYVIMVVIQSKVTDDDDEQTQ